MLQSLRYSEPDWWRAHAGQGQSRGITMVLASQWEEGDALCGFIVTGGGGSCTGRTVGTDGVSPVDLLRVGEETCWRFSVDQEMETQEESRCFNLPESCSHERRISSRHR